MTFKMPSSLSLNGNLANNLKKFKFSIEIYMKAAWHNENDTSTKTTILLNVLGEEALDLFDMFNLKVEEKTDYEKLLRAFKE